MKKNFLLWMGAVLMMTILAFGLTGCQTAPRVIAELTEHHPARQADSVMVYELGDQVPAEQEHSSWILAKQANWVRLLLIFTRFCAN